MLKIICPGCGQKIEAPDGARNQRIKCPTCENEFVGDPEKPRSFSKVDDIRNTAGNFRALAIFFALVGVFFLVVSGICLLANDSGVSGVYIGCSLIGFSLWLYLIAQVMHIRANTHK